MPQVPVYNGPQIREQALQGGFQQNVDVGRSARVVGQALTQVGEVADRVVMRDAEAKANDADTQITRAWNDWEDKNRGKFTNQNADGYKAAVDGWWKEAAKTYGGTLDPMSQAMVNKTLARRQTLALDQAGKHEFVEKEKYADSTTDSAVNSATVNALKTGDYAGESQRVRDLVAAQGVRKNWDKDQRDTALNARLGTFNLAVITQLAEKDAAAAQTYLTGAIERGEIKPDQQFRLEQIVKGEADNQFAQTEAVRIRALPAEQQKAELAKITDPKRLEKTQLQMRNLSNADKEQAQAVEQKASDQAWQLVGQGKRVPEAILASMDGKERVQLQEHLRAKAERGLAAPKTDPKDHARLIDMMLNDPEGFKKERLAAARLSPTDLEQFATKQQAMRNPTGGAKQDSIFTDDQRVYGALTKAGVDPKKNPNAAYQVRSEIDRRVRADSLAKGGRDLTPDEKQKHIDDVLVDKVFVNEFGRDPQKPLALLTPEEQKNAYVTVNGEEIKLSSIPLDVRAASTESLRKAGLPVTEQAIAEDYLALLAARKEKSAPAAPVAPAVPATPAAPAAPRASFPAPSAALRPPSIYAPAQEWAAYRAAQARLATGKN